MKVLVVSYSQTGQLHEILERFLEPFDKNWIEWVQVKEVNPILFPWTSEKFFDMMPETVLEEPIAIEPLSFQESKYDLILFGYQPWFLSPSIVMSSVLQDNRFKAIAKGTPVITISGCRNMWLNAQESVKKHLKRAGAILVGNIPFVDRNPNLLSVLPIMHWAFTGRKEKKWGIFPMPGVSKSDIDFANIYGQDAVRALKGEGFSDLQQRFLAHGKISIPTDILFIEERAKRLFLIWANLIKTKGTTSRKRSTLVSFFKYYLLIALFLVSPILLTIYFIFFRPFLGKQIAQKKSYYTDIHTKD